MARKGLGRGLGALLSSPETEENQPQETAQQSSSAPGGSKYIDIRKIEPNKDQPRQYFDEAALEELADSIRTYGIIQPLILMDCGDYYSIIAGERRFRAARLANLDSVPAIIKEYTELESLQIALIENIQREDLTPIEEALCYKRLMDDFFFSQEDIAGKVGKSRVAISSAVRLLDLDSRVQDLISFGQLTVSHSKALLTVDDSDKQAAIAAQIAEEGLSVRTAEGLIAAKLNEPDVPDIPESEEEQPAPKSADVRAAFRKAEDELKSILGARVNIMQGKKKGKIEIEYYSPEELDRLLGYFKVNL